MKIGEKNGNFIITDFSELEAYKIACKIETDGIDFYQRLLEKTSEERLKETLNFLLLEERKHLKIFEEAKFELRKRVDDSSDEDLLSSMDFGIFQPYQSIDELNQVLDNPQKAFKLGIIIEDKSIKFYTLCKEKVSAEEAKRELSKIIQEEYQHKKLLADMLKEYEGHRW
ncbi:MAG: ferritin family protein [Candidatus Omnitrophica bacterium]|nr:ferritin family protein [Candidatus Omnitrophota bacterium]MCM8793825.1 ferritin family protein [Candidatus Omnitrophota bacterium]